MVDCIRAGIIVSLEYGVTLLDLLEAWCNLRGYRDSLTGHCGNKILHANASRIFVPSFWSQSLMWLRTCCPDGAAKDQTIITDISRFLYEVKPPILLRTSWPYPLRHFLASRWGSDTCSRYCTRFKVSWMPHVVPAVDWCWQISPLCFLDGDVSVYYDRIDTFGQYYQLETP